MAPPTWVTGQVLTASDVDTWFVPLVAYKTADTTRANTSTTTGDPDLTIPIATSAFYRFEMHLAYTGSSTASQGIKAVFVVPTGTFLRYHLVGVSNASTAPLTGNTWLASSTIVLGTASGVNSGASLLGTLFTGTTAGSVTFSWAQNISEATGITAMNQSCMMLTRIG